MSTVRPRAHSNGRASSKRKGVLVYYIVASVGLMGLALHYFGPSTTKKQTPGKQTKLALDMQTVADTEATQPYPYDLNPMKGEFDFTAWTALGGGRYAEYAAGGTPWIVTDEARLRSDDRARSRRDSIRDAMKFAWSGYVNYAFGFDELKPVTGKGDNVWGGMGTTLVDSLDTLWLMDMKEEFWQGRDWVLAHLNHDHVGTVSVFETTIRSLAGLLSAYDWSHDEVFLIKARDLGDRLMKAFDGSKSGIPYSKVNLSNGHTGSLLWTGGKVIIAEGATLQLEFRYLARVTGKKDYAEKVERVFEIYNKMEPKNGLYPHLIKHTVDPPQFGSNYYTFGAMTDSLYEYMLKIWLQGGRKEPMYRDMYDKAIQGLHDELIQVSTPSGLTYIANKKMGRLQHKQHHLACFMGGVLPLGAYTDPLGLQSERAQRDLKTGKVSVDKRLTPPPSEWSNEPHTLGISHLMQALAYTCYQMYARMNTGVSPDSVKFIPQKDLTIDTKENVLRPEAFESFFILNYLTGDPVYREWGWECFSAIQRYCKTNIAYGQLPDVSNPKRQPRDKMESFFLGESLKYLYLLQNPETEVDILNKHVFNTEAHPMRIFPVMDTDNGAPTGATQTDSLADTSSTENRTLPDPPP